MKTKKHIEYWKNRKIDWKTSYLDTWNHPHRNVISHVLSTFPWMSLFEIGCGSGANLVNIIKRYPHKQLGGVDINSDAIELARQTLQGGFFKVGSALDLMVSDDAVDVTLSDMCLIYVDPSKIDTALGEIKRITRNHVIFCEFHSKSFYDRIKLRLTSGYHAYNYEKLLEKHGFYDIETYKLTEEMWPGGNPQKTFGFIIKAKVPKRK